MAETDRRLFLVEHDLRGLTSWQLAGVHRALAEAIRRENLRGRQIRYVQRMQQAVRVLYGQASPGEAFEATRLALQPVDLDAFLGHVAENARYIGIEAVQYSPHGRPLLVRADEHCLEDVVTHVLRNARCQPPRHFLFVQSRPILDSCSGDQVNFILLTAHDPCDPGGPLGVADEHVVAVTCQPGRHGAADRAAAEKEISHGVNVTTT